MLTFMFMLSKPRIQILYSKTATSNGVIFIFILNQRWFVYIVLYILSHQGNVGMVSTSLSVAGYPYHVHFSFITNSIILLLFFNQWKRKNDRRSIFHDKIFMEEM